MPERYELASPAEQLPLGVGQLLVHGERERVVPPGSSSRYAAAAKAAGDDVKLRIYPKTGHMEVIDPAGDSWQFAAGWLRFANEEPI